MSDRRLGVALMFGTSEAFAIVGERELWWTVPGLAAVRDGKPAERLIIAVPKPIFTVGRVKISVEVEPQGGFGKSRRKAKGHQRHQRTGCGSQEMELATRSAGGQADGNGQKRPASCKI